MKKLGFAALVLLVLAGCAGTDKIAPEALRQPDAGTAEIIVYRPWAWVGQAISSRIYIDDQKVAAIGVNEMTAIRATAGQYSVKADFWGSNGYAEQVVNVEAGKKYIIEAKAGSMRQSIIDGSVLTGKFGDPQPQGGMAKPAVAEATASLDELRGYSYVSPYVPEVRAKEYKRSW